jgi:hypothetical protein
MDETLFYRLKLNDAEALELSRFQQSNEAPELTALRQLLRFSYVYGCVPFGRLDPAHIRREAPVHATLQRTALAVCATQRGYDFRVVCYTFPPVLDPWLEYQSAALLSRDGKFGLLVEYFRRERQEELAYGCTTLLGDGTFLVTRRMPADLFDPPTYRVSACPYGGVRELLGKHAAEIEGLTTVPLAEWQVPGTILALNRDLFEHNIAAGRFTPLPARELALIREAMSGRLL